MYSTVIWYQLLYSFVFIFSWQETFLRTQLMSNHLQFWNTIGYQYDTSIANDMAKPSQEALMKLFAVSWVNDSQMSFIDIPLFSILIFPLQYASIWTSLSSFLFHKNVLSAFYLEFLKCFYLQLSARSDREFRAFEVCEMMSEPHTLQLAIKYACRLKYMQLAERISELVQRKSNEEEEEEEQVVIQKIQRSVLFWRII